MNILVTTYGYLAVALLVGVESIGVPLAGETILIVAAIYAGHTHRLHLDFDETLAHGAPAIAIETLSFAVMALAPNPHPPVETTRQAGDH